MQDYCFFDTAEIYGSGKSEKILGKFVNDHRKGKSKATSNLINSTMTATSITTTASVHSSAVNSIKSIASIPSTDAKIVIGTKYLPYPWRIRYPSSLLSALKDSLSRLGLPCVDLYQIHGPIQIRSFETLADSLATAVELGLVKAVGVSNYNENETRRVYETLKKRGVRLATNQVEFSLLRRLPEESGLIKACHEIGVSVIAYSPLGMGRLTGKYTKTNPPPKNRKFGASDIEDLTEILELLSHLANEYGRSIPQIAINWVICKGKIKKRKRKCK